MSIDSSPFQNPAILWWLLAAIVPILLQLLRRRPQQQTFWGAMALLRRAYRKAYPKWRRRERTQLWLQLAILAAAIGGLAEPHGSESGGTRGSRRRPAHHVVILDRSYSMQTQNGVGSRFDRARQLARQIIQRQPAGDWFSLWSLDDRPAPILRRPSPRREDFLSALAAVTAGMGRANLHDLPRRIEDGLERQRAANPAVGDGSVSQLWILTDLQRGTWELNAHDRAAWQQLAERTRLQIIDVAGTPVDNVAVSDLHCDFPVIDAPAAITAVLQNFSSTRQADRTATLRIDGDVVGSHRVSIPPEQTRTIIFEYRFDRLGMAAASIVLAPDSLAVDDRRYAALEVRDAIHADCWEGLPDAARPIEAALLAAGRPHERFRVTRRTGPARVESAEENADVVVLTGPFQGTPDEAHRLQDFVAAGGGLVVFAEATADGRKESTALNVDRNGQPFLPASIGRPSDLGEYHFDTDDLTHPLLDVFAGSQRSVLESTPIWRYRELTATDHGEPVLSLRHGALVIAGGRYGQGRVVVCGIPLAQAEDEDPWSALVAWPSFPPLMRQIVRFSALGRIPPTWVVGQHIRGTCREYHELVKLVRPSQSVATIATAQVQGRTTWDAGIIDDPGNYRIVTTGGATLQAFSVNVDPAEGDLVKVDPARIPREKIAVKSAQDLESRALLSQSGYRRAILVLAMILSVVEAILFTPDLQRRIAQ